MRFNMGGLVEMKKNPYLYLEIDSASTKYYWRV